MLIALVSAKGAPGTSTLALALALNWPSPVLMAECDPRGGDLLYGYGQGAAAAGRGLLSLQVSSRNRPMSSVLWDQVISLECSDTWVLPGLEESRHAGSIHWPSLAQVFSGESDIDVIADCGVVPAVSAPSPIWSAADLVVLVTRSTMRSTHASESAVSLIRSDLVATGLGVDRLVSVIVGPGHPYPRKEIETFFKDSAPVVGVVDWDPAGAAVLAEGEQAGRRFERTPVMRSASSLAQVLGATALSNKEQATFRMNELRTGMGPFGVPAVNGYGGAR